MFECIIIIEILWFEMLSVDLSLPESEAPFSLKKSSEEKEEGALRDSALLPRLLSFIKGSIKGRRLFTSEFGLVLK